MMRNRSPVGLHDPGGEHLLGGQGWIVFTEVVNSSPGNYQRWVDAGYNVIVRLNHGYSPSGTIPTPDYYTGFARSCATWVAASRGIDFLVIGNEIAHHYEWPTDKPLTLATYLDCYKRCYDAIKAVAPGIKIAPQAVAPWNDSTPDARDWICQLSAMLTALPGRVDWIALHAYTRAYSPDAFVTGARMGPPYEHRYVGWETLYEFMAAIPPSLRHLPVVITECNGNAPWSQYQPGWILRLYGKLNEWNVTPGNQQIMGACLFRWAKHDKQWDISRCAAAHADLRTVVAKGYRWQTQPQTGFSAWTGYVAAAPYLRLRAEPNTDSPVLAEVKLGESVTVTDQRNGWLQVRYEALSGWMAAALVSQQKPNNVYVPIVTTGGSDFDKAIAFVLRWEGVYSTDRNDPGNYTGGQVGVGEFKGTKFGISAGSYPNVDIANLTQEQAVQIYERDYWQRSGADDLPWPLCLVHLDSAVNAGVGKAQQWMQQSGSNPLRYLALRLEFYTKLKTWSLYGAAWTQRVADLMKAAAG